MIPPPQGGVALIGISEQLELTSILPKGGVRAVLGSASRADRRTCPRRTCPGSKVGGPHPGGRCGSGLRNATGESGGGRSGHGGGQ